MSEKKNLNKKRIILILLSVVTVLLSVIIWQLLAPFQLDNDNIYLKTLASGEATGIYEAHLCHMAYPSGLIIKALYTITGNSVPWFGIELCFSFAVTMILILYKALSAVKKKWVFFYLIPYFILIYTCIFYQYFAKTQYTLATGIAGIGALFVVSLVREDDKKLSEYLYELIPAFLLAFWSMGMRQKAFIMLIPFFGMVFLGKMIDAVKGDKKDDPEKSGTDKKEVSKRVKKVILSFAILAGVVLISFVTDKIGYSSPEWKAFREYNSIRESLFDYDGFPQYDEHHKDVYEKTGITESSYEAVTKHYNLIMDENINAESMSYLAEVSKEENRKPISVFYLFQTLTEDIIYINIFDYQDRPLNLIVFALYFIVLVLAIVNKRSKAIRDMAFIFIARTFDWFYLVYNGRYPFRVTQILYVAELALLIAIILKYELWKKKALSIIASVLVLLLSVRLAYPVAKKDFEQIKGSRELSVSFRELEDYMEAHPDNFYFFDMSHLYYTEDTLSFGKKEYENYVYMGSWMPNSPWYDNKMKAWGIDDPGEALLEKDNVFIMYQNVDFDTRDFLDYYFEEHFPGSRIEVKDTFTSSNGFVYEVLKPTY